MKNGIRQERRSLNMVRHIASQLPCFNLQKKRIRKRLAIDEPQNRLNIPLRKHGSACQGHYSQAPGKTRPARSATAPGSSKR